MHYLSIVIRLWARPRFDSGRGQDFFSLPLHSDQLWGPPSLPSNGYWGLFPQS